MIPISDDERLQRELDGESAAEESAALRKRLAEEPLLQHRYHALQHAVRAVGRLPWVEAPEGLAEDVMRQLRRRAAPTRRGGPAGFGRALLARPVRAYGSALAAGLLLGAFLFGPAELSRPPGSDAALSGAALPTQTIARPPVGEVLRLAEGPLRASALWRPTAGGVRLELTIEAPEPVDATLRFDPTALRARAVELDAVPGGEATFGSGRVELRQVRAGHYAVDFLTTPSLAQGVLSVRLESQGRVVEGDLGLGPES